MLCSERADREGGDELGVDELEKGLELLAAAVAPTIVPEEDVV